MKKYLGTLTDLLFMKTKKSKIISYSILGLFIMYFSIICYPNFIFAYALNYKNFKVHSTQPLGDSIKKILDMSEQKLITSEIYNKKITQNIYLCNNYNLYTFLTPLSRKAFAANFSFLNNIFIASCNYEKNQAYKNDENDNYTRQLSSLISHETTHTFIEKKIGFWKNRSLSNWKKEGYCEYVGCGPINDIETTKTILTENANQHTPGSYYKRYYIAVNYLKTVEKMTIEEIFSTELTLDEVLKKIEESKTENLKTGNNTPMPTCPASS